MHMLRKAIDWYWSSRILSSSFYSPHKLLYFQNCYVSSVDWAGGTLMPYRVLAYYMKLP